MAGVTKQQFLSRIQQALGEAGTPLLVPLVAVPVLAGEPSPPPGRAGLAEVRSSAPPLASPGFSGTIGGPDRLVPGGDAGIEDLRLTFTGSGTS